MNLVIHKEKPKLTLGRQVFSADYIPKKCKYQVYIKDNIIYIKANDWFSPVYCKPEDIGTPLRYRSNKYGLKQKKEKFVYNDNWGAIVIRNRVWIEIQGLQDEIKQYKSLPMFTPKQPLILHLTNIILRNIETYYKIDEYELECTDLSRCLEAIIDILIKDNLLN